MAKKISFNELCKMVAKIDYLYKESYPIVFSVEDDDCIMKHECGITKAFEFQGVQFDEYQYLVTTEFKSKEHKHEMDYVRHLVDPDDVSFSEISEVLKDKCHIDENSIITLYEGKSFKGRKRYIEKVTPEICEMVTQSDLTKEVKKGIEWFKEILKTDVVLISTKRNEGRFEYDITNLNGLSGSDFAFLIDRKVLYYDTLRRVLCTYAPTNGHRELETFYTRIECNDNFKWLLLYICNGEDLLSSVKLCNIEIKEPFEEPRYITGINQEKIEATYNKICALALAAASKK